jgi:ribose transport system substrate-binding protein
MSRKRLIIWPLVAILCVAGFVYRKSVFQKPAPPPSAQVAFVTGGSGPYWQLTVDGAKAAAAKHNVELQVEMPSDDENIEQQMGILAHLDMSEVDGIALSPIDAEGQTDLINQLVRREKKIVTFDSDAPLSTRQSHVGTSNFAAGRICAGLVNDAIPSGGKIAVLLANLTKENLQDRKAGFQERINQLTDDVPEGSPNKFELVGYLVDNGKTATCEQNIRDVVAKHPDLAIIVGMNAKHGPILLETLKELDKLGAIKLVTFDDAEETLDGVEAGEIYATVAQDPYRFGYEAVTTLAALCSGDETSVPIVGRGSTYVGAEAIRKDNVESFRTRLKSRQPSMRADGGSKKAA